MNFTIEDIISFGWSELYYLDYENEIGINALRKLNQNQEESLNQTIKEFAKQIKEDDYYQSLDEGDKVDYYRQIYDREEQIIKEIKRQQRYSLILTIFSFFEGRLKSYCDLIKEKENLEFDSSNKKEPLTLYWNFLKKAYKIDIKAIEASFTKIKQQKIIRNTIAHNEGIIKNEKLKKITLIEGLKFEAIGDKSIIYFEKDGYIVHLLNLIYIILLDLLKAIEIRRKTIESNV